MDQPFAGSEIVFLGRVRRNAIVPARPDRVAACGSVWQREQCLGLDTSEGQLLLLSYKPTVLAPLPSQSLPSALAKLARVT